ncbi:hypothetical protein IAR55_002116 [Kwoniella newhampshirensis]|uniref:Eukaryotic mitochondrial regulator protein-domain-containing protein n=1 Tax=Kwoniella newhampshirensis TaxID=1651941 RepID=A0AAW0YTN3_9TREE
MPFTTSIAGPSRLPFQAITTCRRSLLSSRRRWASTEATPEISDDVPPPSDAAELTLDPSPIDDVAQAGTGRKAGKVFFREWLRTEGEQFRVPVKGRKAQWLGEGVPYPSNPTFRPPPPLSNYVQDQVFAELRRGRTVAELSEKYNISKARIEAVRKLKEVEAEFKRRSLPLQKAFLDGLEPLLGVQVPINPNTREHDASRARQIDLAHDSHPSTATERLEEQRWESGVGQEGAFGGRTRDAAKQGIEHTAWEFRDEETVLEDRRVLKAKEEEVKREPSHEGVAAEVLHREVLSASLFQNPATEQAKAKKAKDEERAKRAAKDTKKVQGVTIGGIHFVDTSGTKVFGGENKGEKIREKRHRRAEKKKQA